MERKGVIHRKLYLVGHHYFLEGEKLGEYFLDPYHLVKKASCQMVDLINLLHLPNLQVLPTIQDYWANHNHRPFLRRHLLMLL